jgi:anti-repressor protein
VTLSLALDFDGRRVRMVGTPDDPEWIASDVCDVLELRGPNPWKHLPDGCKGKHSALTPGGWQKVVTINEQGLYRLIAVSRVPRAEDFRRLVFGEVLPCIRRHGCYPAPDAIVSRSLNVDLRDPKMLAALTLQLTEIVREKEAENAELRPKAEAFDAFMSGEGGYTMARAANILARPHRPMGEKRLFQFCRERGIFRSDNAPYQEHIEAGRFFVVAKSWTDSDEERHPYFQTFVTGAGIEYLRKRLDAAEGQHSLLPARSESVVLQ